jgi:hypothetical protein
MAVNHDSAIDYQAVLADLLAKMELGQARFENWQAEKNELAATIQGIRAILARNGSQSAAADIPGISSVGIRPQPVNFYGLTYRQAVRKCFEMRNGGPLTAPDVADLLLNAGYDKERTRIKNNVDGTFRILRERGVIQKTADGTAYELNKGPQTLL